MSENIPVSPPGGPVKDDVFLAAGRAVDLLMGLAMMLLALTHAREFFSDANYWPGDLAKTTAPSIATRMRTEVTSNGSTYLLNSSVPMLFGSPFSKPPNTTE